MTNTPFRRGPKIGRNEPCFCGSGRKFKHCHGGVEHTLPALLQRQQLEKTVVQEAERLIEKRKAQEIQRQKQQGLGRPVISVEHNGYRFVAVGDRLVYGKWKTFTDFLTAYIKQTLGPSWGNAEIAKPLAERHPVMQWYDKICHLQAAHAKKKGDLFSTPITGAVSAYNRLAYNLYLIAHNGKDIESLLISRLKNKNSFQGAFFETQVAAWLIRAGFELEFEDESDRRSTHCEFIATHIETGEKYSVEAKSREIESTKSSRPKVGRKLYEALEKKADYKRLVFIDLNKPIHTKEAAEIAIKRAERIIRQSEGQMKIDGQPAPEAYVCITNMNDQYVLDAPSLATAISFVGFKIHDYMGNSFPSFRQAARARERHWPMFQLFRSIEEHRDIPQTFGGELPSEAFGSENPRTRLQIGEFYAVTGVKGDKIRAKLTNVTVGDGKAYCFFYDPETDRSWISEFEMTADELTEYEKHPDTYFGVYQRQQRKTESAMDLFDFFVEGYRNTPKERLIELLSNYSDQESLRGMSQKELVELLAEGYAASLISGKQ